MIKLAGYKPDIDIPITFSGIRPMEKLFEEYQLKMNNLLNTRFITSLG